MTLIKTGLKGQPVKDEIGNTYNLLTVKDRAPNQRTHKASWEVECQCGNRVIREGARLRSDQHYSCGCVRRPLREGGKRKNSNPDRRRLAKIWGGMHYRCYNDESPAYCYYGGKGVRIDRAWKTLDDFYEWAMATGYRAGLSIDRINVKGNYGPKNCRWATPAEQARNRTSTVIDQSKADAIRALLDLGAPPILIAQAGGYRNHIVYNIKNNGAWS